jgi:hypothetical protein
LCLGTLKVVAGIIFIKHIEHIHCFDNSISMTKRMITLSKQNWSMEYVDPRYIMERSFVAEEKLIELMVKYWTYNPDESMHI